MIVYVDGKDLVEFLAHRDDSPVVPGDPVKSRLSVAGWLARYAECQDCDIVLVFDENPVGEILPPFERHGRVRVVNLEPGAEALHEIAGPANREAVRDRVFVVTADPRLARALEHGRARVVEPGAFFRRTRTVMRRSGAEGGEEADEKFSGLSEDQVDYWMRFFGDREQ